MADDFNPDDLINKPAPAAAAMTVRPSAAPDPDLSPAMQGVLNTIIAPGESSGKYNVIYGGKTVDDLSHHPGIYVPITEGPNAGKKSSAAGKYQFLESTWNEAAKALGLNDFSPKSQDEAAAWLAKRTYQSSTGRDLEKDYASGDPRLREGIRHALASQWESLGHPGPRMDKLWTLGNDRFRFADEAMDQHKDREDTDLVYMRPQDYLTLSPSMDEDPSHSMTGWQQLRTSLAAGEPVKSLPTLSTTMDGSTANVTAQDGRSRALLAQLSGVDAIPVAMKREGDGTPTEVKGMQGQVVPAHAFAPVNQFAVDKQDGGSLVARFLGISPAHAEEVNDPRLEPVEGNPFAAAPSDPRLEAVDGNPFEAAKPKGFMDKAGEIAGKVGRGIADTSAAVTRGLAPYAAGAATGAAIGAPFGGVGAIPGAVAGAGAVGATQLATGLAGLKGPKDATDALLDAVGIKRSGSQTSRVVENAVEGAASAATGAGALGMVSRNIVNPLAKAITGALANTPSYQAISGAASAAVTQMAAEAKLPKAAQEVAGFIAGLIPYPTSIRAFGSVQASARSLMDEGIHLTPGQMAGGAARRIEDSLASVPVLGSEIRKAQRQSVMTFNRAAINRSLDDIGGSLPQGMNSGHDAIAEAERQFHAAYDQIIPNMSGRLDARMANDLAAIRARATSENLPQEYQNQLEHILTQEIASRFAAGGGTITGKDAQKIGTQIDALTKSMRISDNPYVQHMGRLVRDADTALNDMMERNNPALQAAKNKIDAGYSKFKIVQQAASTAAGLRETPEGTFTPSQLSRAVRARDRSKDKAAFARGDAQMQDLSGNARDVLPSVVPDSGTPERGALMAILAGGANIEPHMAAAGGAAMIPYTAAGGRAINRFMTKPVAQPPLSVLTTPLLATTPADSATKGMQ